MESDDSIEASADIKCVNRMLFLLNLRMQTSLGVRNYIISVEGATSLLCHFSTNRGSE